MNNQGKLVLTPENAEAISQFIVANMNRHSDGVVPPFMLMAFDETGCFQTISNIDESAYAEVFRAGMASVIRGDSEELASIEIEKT